MSNMPPSPFLSFASVGPSLAETATAPNASNPQGDAVAGRFVLDERAFMEALEEPPAFLSSPRPQYLAIVETLAGR